MLGVYICVSYHTSIACSTSRRNRRENCRGASSVVQFNGYCLEYRGKVPGLFRSLVKRLASMVCASFVNQGEQRVSE